MIFGGDEVNGVTFSAAKMMKISVNHDMTGIPLEAAVHKLSLDPNFPSVRQKKRPIAELRNMFVKEEITRLLNIGSIQEIGKIMEVYIDDMLVKSLNAGDHLKHHQETFDILRKYNMKLNPEKCAFAGVTTIPLRNVLHKPELPGRLAKWTVEVSEFDIKYKPRTAIKSQVLDNFVANFSPGLMTLAAKEAVLVSGIVLRVWTLLTDWTSNMKGSGLGVVLSLLWGKRHAIRTVSVTNNEADYEALVAGIESILSTGTKAACYCLVDEQLYRRSFQGPLSRCLGNSEADYVMWEVHEGVFGNHSGADSLVLKLVRVG
ncbi:uncharacterized protein [Nicotiana tomentosiformis]|uniref:uncharacterized protein n=1 Tax=Nicotiana tomentosiformis TaxID=4098 RepID=UPI00388C6D90